MSSTLTSQLGARPSTSFFAETTRPSTTKRGCGPVMSPIIVNIVPPRRSALTPPSMRDSNTWLPIAIRSPGLSATPFATRDPLMNVPLSDWRSVAMKSSPLFEIAQCAGLASGSKIR